MKKILGLMIVVLMATFIYSQQIVTYKITCDPPVVTDSVSRIDFYIETEPNNGSFLMRDGQDYDPSLDAFFVGSLTYTGIIPVEYYLEFPYDGQFRMPGVIFYNGLRSQLGTGATVRIPKKPGKPNNVRLEKVSP
jgi:hypothetical protein